MNSESKAPTVQPACMILWEGKKAKGKFAPSQHKLIGEWTSGFDAMDCIDPYGYRWYEIDAERYVSVEWFYCEINGLRETASLLNREELLSMIQDVGASSVMAEFINNLPDVVTIKPTEESNPWNALIPEQPKREPVFVYEGEKEIGTFYPQKHQGKLLGSWQSDNLRDFDVEPVCYEWYDIGGGKFVSVQSHFCEVIGTTVGARIITQDELLKLLEELDAEKELIAKLKGLPEIEMTAQANVKPEQQRQQPTTNRILPKVIQIPSPFASIHDHSNKTHVIHESFQEIAQFCPNDHKDKLIHSDYTFEELVRGYDWYDFGDGKYISLAWWFDCDACPPFGEKHIEVTIISRDEFLKELEAINPKSEFLIKMKGLPDVGEVLRSNSSPKLQQPTNTANVTHQPTTSLQKLLEDINRQSARPVYNAVPVGEANRMQPKEIADSDNAQSVSYPTVRAILPKLLKAGHIRQHVDGKYFRDE